VGVRVSGGSKADEDHDQNQPRQPANCRSRLSVWSLRLRGGTQDKKMAEGHLPRRVCHQVYNVYSY